MSEPSAPLPLRILVCQTAALSGDVRENIARWGGILAAYCEEDEIDIVQFPETAFSRYFFRDAADAAPSMELEGQGPVFHFVSQLAKRLRAYVVCGYMEKRSTMKIAAMDGDAELGGEGKVAQALGLGSELHGRVGGGYNSLYVVSREGELLRESYHKRHLFQPDCAWCQPGAQDQRLTLQLWSRCKSRDFIVGLINCQEILGDMDDRDAQGGPAARRLRNEFCSRQSGYDAIDVVLFSTCWPLFLSDLPEPPKDFAGIWQRAIKTDFLLKEQAEAPADGGETSLRKRPLVFSVACCVGSEKNMTTPEGWGGRTKLQDKFSLEYLAKRGCSGVKVYSVAIGDRTASDDDMISNKAITVGESDVHAEVPLSKAHAPPADAKHYAAEPWAPGQQCMSHEFEEARIFSLQLECADGSSAS